MDDDRDGDFRLLEQWVDDHQGALYRAACLILRDPTAAEDVAQETFVRAYGSRTRVEPADVGRWLRRITVNLALNRLRSLSREQKALSRVSARLVAGVDPADDGVGRIDARDAVARLPQRL